MYPYVAKVHWGYFDDFDNKYHELTDNVLLYADSFIHAMTILTGQFGEKELVSVDLACVADENTLFTVSENLADLFIKNEGDLSHE